MKKLPKMYWRNSHRCWYLNLDGKQHRLSPDKALAQALYLEKLAGKGGSGGHTLGEIVVKFYDELRQTRSPNTQKWYKERIKGLVAHVGKDTQAEQVTPDQVSSYLAKHRHWSANTRHGAIRAIKRLYRWASKQKLISVNPLADLENVTPQASEDYVTPELMSRLLQVVPDSQFKDVLVFAWDTGARPQEIFRVEARHWDGTRKCLVLPPSEAKTRRIRTIYIGTERAESIVQQRVVAYPAGPLFRNSKGVAWNKNSVKCAFSRLKKKYGIDTHLGAFRKGFATMALKSGVDVVTLAHLMGHASTSMLMKHYAKVGQESDYMLQAARKIRRE